MVKTVLGDLAIIGLFLMAGVVLRAIIKPLQKIFIPASFIGGALMLVLGPQVLGVLTLPETTSQYSGALVDIVLTCLVWGVTINGKKIISYLDYCCVGIGQKGMQLAVGSVLGLLLAKIWTGLPPQWGTVPVFCFVGGHGTAASVGAVYEELGVPDMAGLGVIMSTIGLLAAIVGGLIFINIGARRGWTKYISAEEVAQRIKETGGKTILPPEKRNSMGETRVSNDGINNLLLQIIMILGVWWFGGKVIDLVTIAIPWCSNLPSILDGIIGAVIIWPIMCKLKIGELVDRKMVSNISGLCLDLVVVSAVASMNLDLITAYWMPIAIMSVVMIALTYFLDVYYLKKCAKADWFEKAMLLYGMGTGTSATGIALVRAMDPDSQSCAVEAQAVHNSSSELLSMWWPAGIPMIAMSSVWVCAGIGAVYSIVALAVGWVLLRKGVKAIRG